MSIKDQLTVFDPAIRFTIHLPSKSKLKQTAKSLEKQLDTPTSDLSFPPHLLEETVRLMSGRQAHTVTQRNLRLFCVAGLSSFKEVEQAAITVQYLLDEVKRRAKKSLYRGLLTGYLQIADLDYDWTARIRLFLLDRVDQLPSRWRLRCQTYGLLDARPCQALARSFLNLDESFSDQMVDAGMTGALTMNGIGRSLLQAVCEELCNVDWLVNVDADALLSRFLDYVSPNDKLLFQGSQSQVTIVRALLTPCLNSDVAPHLIRRIQHFLLNAYSDPRVNPGKWGQVPQEFIDLLTRWLTKQAMGLLIEVLNKTADDHHWESRHDFWNYYLDNDLVDEAWVVFGPNAYVHARELVRSDKDFSAGTFAKLDKGAGQIQPNHSVLLMRIDSVVVAEWTHNGRVRLWDHVSAGTPRFYRPSYKSEVLRGSARNPPQDEYTHDVHGHWKRKVASFIQDRTGIQHGKVRVPKSTVQRVRVPTSPVHANPVSSGSFTQDTRPTFSGETSRTPHEPAPGTVKTGTCKACGKTKPASEFHLSRRRPGELTVFCKECSAKDKHIGSAKN